MALPSTIYRFKIKLSDIDRGLYETLQLRLAMHPSESIGYLLTRLIAYGLNYQEGIEFTEGISSPDDPAIWVKDLTGVLKLWIEIGNPTAKRLHKASKASSRVRIYTHRDPENLKKELLGEEIHKRDLIEVFSIPQMFLKNLGEKIERDNTWEILYNEGELTVSTPKDSFQTEIASHRI